MTGDDVPLANAMAAQTTVVIATMGRGLSQCNNNNKQVILIQPVNSEVLVWWWWHDFMYA